mgnify:CR=1 FL=1
MQIFNTLTRQKEEFVPQVPGEYRIYVCGPTVYNYIHIGNARPLIVFDTLRRYLEYRGNKVIYVSNITDIDDKLIKKGQEEGTSMQEVARKFEAEYIRDSDGLNVKAPTVRPRATEHIGEIIKIVKDLDQDLSGKDVLIVEDIIDSGNTLYYLMDVLRQRKPASLRLCTLLDKPDRRVKDVHVDWTGFEIPDEFVVGYGLDYAQKYRNLPYIGVVEVAE